MFIAMYFKKRQSFFILCFVLPLMHSTSLFAQTKDMNYFVQSAPFKMSNINISDFNNKTFSIIDFGGKPDGKTLCTDAFAKAIEACEKVGGGRVLVPSGTWLTGPIELLSNVDLHLEKGALIQFTADHTQYPLISMEKGKENWVTASPIYARNASHIAITGEGVIDGAGDSWRPVKKSKVSEGLWNQLKLKGVISSDGKIWWPNVEAMNGENYLQKLKSNTGATKDDYLPAREFLRPYMLYLAHCDSILVSGVTLQNSPKFVFYPTHCTNLLINKINVYNDWWAQNGDGIDISACKNVIILNTTVNAGDDGICMKSSGSTGKNNSPALENIIIAGCTVRRAHGGFVIGSNTDGGMRNIYVTDCNFVGSDIGVRVKSNPGRGGLVTNIYVNNIIMSQIKEDAISFTTTYEDQYAGKNNKTSSSEDDNKVPVFQGFHFSNIVCTGALGAILISGLKNNPINHIDFENVSITATDGFRASNASNINLNHVLLKVNRPVFSISESSDILQDGIPVK